MKTPLIASLVTACAAFALPAFAQDNTEGPNYDETLTGSWNGLRNQWAKQGLNVDINWRMDTFGVTDGGLKRGGQPMHHLEGLVAADLGKLTGAEGLTGLLHVFGHAGGHTNAERVGSLMGVSNEEVPVRSGKVFQAWLQQEFMEGQFAVLAGLYPIDTEFSVMESAGIFTHPAYGASADLAVTDTPSIFNTSALGLRARWKITPEIYAMAATLDGRPGDPNNPKGTHVRLNDGDGTMSIYELGYKPEAKAGTFTKAALGYWRYSNEKPDLAQANRQHVSWGAYVLGEKTLATEFYNLTAFGRYSLAEGKTSPVRSALNLGLTAKGLIPGRSDDVTGVAVTRGRFSSSFLESGDAVPDQQRNETAWEITHQAQLTPWLSLQPVVQYIRRPAGDPAIRNATLVGVRSSVRF